MRIFLTGATGFIGSALIPELIQAGHQVLGLTRSEEGAKSLLSAGAQPHHGSLEDLESLSTGAAQSDGVIHCAFNHDFSRYEKSAEEDRRAIDALGDALAGSNRPLIATGGLGPWAPGRLTTETDEIPEGSPIPRVSEQAALAQIAKGVKAGVMRLPQVHDTFKQGIVTPIIAIAREKGVSAYVGDGSARWPAAHLLDVARLYRLAFEQLEPGARYHAVAEQGVSFKDITEAIGRGLKLPVISIPAEEAQTHFGYFFGTFAGLDLAASSTLTQQRLGWRPTGPGLIEDLNNMRFD